MRHLLSALLVTAGLLGGCAAPPVAMDQRLQADLKSAETVLVMPLSALAVDVNPTNIGGGLLDQLLASIIDSKRRETATEAARPLLTQIEGYDIRGAMREAWAQAFTAAGVSSLATPLRAEHSGPGSPQWAARKRALFDASEAAAVLYAAIDYRLQSGVLRITCQVEAYPRAATLLAYRKAPDANDPLAEGNAIYRKDFVHAKEFVTANNIRRSLDEGVRDLARQVATDLARPMP